MTEAGLALAVSCELITERGLAVGTAAQMFVGSTGLSRARRNEEEGEGERGKEGDH